MSTSLILITSIVSHAWFTITSPPPLVPLLLFFALSSFLITLNRVSPLMICMIAMILCCSVNHLYHGQLAYADPAIPPESISVCSFTVLEDSDLSQHLSPMTRVRITGIRDRRGLMAPCSLHALMFGDLMLLQGQKGEAAVRFSKEGDQVYLSADTFSMEEDTVFIQVRRKVLSYLASLFERKSGGAHALLQLLLLSMVSEEGNRIMEQARGKGVSHLFVLSGFHLQLITGGLSLLFHGRKSRFLILAAAHLYVAAVGYAPSLTRALIALTISRAVILNRSPSSLLITFTLHAILVPHHLFTYSAALSYTAVTALMFLYPAVRSLLFPLLPFFITVPLALSLSAFIGTSPVAFLLFSALHPEGILYTMLLSPLMLPLSILTLLIFIVPLPVCTMMHSLLVSGVLYLLDLAPIAPLESYLPVVLALIMMLTWFLLQWYCSRILQKRSIRRYELDVSLRLAFRDSPSAGEPFSCHEQEVRPELPPFTRHAYSDCTAYPQ